MFVRPVRVLCACVLGLGIGSGSEAAAPSPWLRSGFEDGVRLTTGRDGRVELTGVDASTGFDWTKDVPARRANFFSLVRSQPEGDFVQSLIEDVPSAKGAANRALRMEVSARDPQLPPGLVNRNEYSLFHPNYRQAYVRYAMKLQPDAAARCPLGDIESWRMFFELKEPDSGVKRLSGTGNRHTGTNNYRISAYIRRKTSGEFYWHVRGESPQPIRTVEWDIFNDRVPVPLDRWFQVEVFFRHDADGLFWLAIDGRQVALRRGATQHPTHPLPLAFWSPFKVYASESWLAAGPVWQWIDDVEIWPEPPPHATPRIDRDANRSTFTASIIGSAAASSTAPLEPSTP